jgi:hypothetical protein
MFVPAFVTSRQRVYGFSWNLVFIGTVEFWFRSQDNNERFAWRSEVIECPWIAPPPPHIVPHLVLSSSRKMCSPLNRELIYKSGWTGFLYQDGGPSAHVRFVSLHVNYIAKYKVVQIWLGLVRLVYTQISPGHIWTILYIKTYKYGEGPPFFAVRRYSKSLIPNHCRTEPYNH